MELLINVKNEEIQRLREILITNERTNVELEEENKILVAQEGNKSSICKELEAKIENLQLEHCKLLQNKKIIIDKLKEELSTLETNNKSDTENEKNSFHVLNEENDELNNKLYCLKSNNETIRQNIEELTREIKTNESVIFELEQLIQQYKTNLTEIENIIEVKENQILENEECCRVSEEKVNALETEIVNANDPMVSNDNKNSLFEEVRIRHKTTKDKLQTKLNQIQELHKQHELKLKEYTDLLNGNINLSKMVHIQKTCHWQCQNNFQVLYDSLAKDLQRLIDQNKEKMSNVPIFESKMVSNNKEFIDWVDSLQNKYLKEIKHYQNKINFYSEKDYFVTRELFEINLKLESAKKNLSNLEP